MRMIRRLDNPLVIKAFGYVESGGLGDFNQASYEEVEGALPADAILEGKQLVEEKKQTNLLMEQSASFRAAFYTIRSAVQAAIESSDLEAANLIVTQSSLQQDSGLTLEQLLELF